MKCNDNLINNAHVIVDGRKLRQASSMVAKAAPPLKYTLMAL